MAQSAPSGVFGREITKKTVICGVYIWFWPTPLISSLHLHLVFVISEAVALTNVPGMLDRLHEDVHNTKLNQTRLTAFLDVLIHLNT